MIHAGIFLSFTEIQMGGGREYPFSPPPNLIFRYFFQMLRMYLRLCRPLTQLRIHFLWAWGPHHITATSSSRPLIFANLGKYRQNWRFLELLPPSFLGESAVWKVLMWSSMQNAKNVQVQNKVEMKLLRGTSINCVRSLWFETFTDWHFSRWIWFCCSQE